MLECIKNDYLAQKARFEQMCREEIAAQKAKADRELIEPKCQDYEKAKAESIRTAQAAYQSAIELAEKTCAESKKAYRELVYDKVEQATNSAFADAIADLDAKLAGAEQK